MSSLEWIGGVIAVIAVALFLRKVVEDLFEDFCETLEE